MPHVVENFRQIMVRLHDCALGDPMSHINLVICGDWLDRLRQKSLDLKKVLALLIIDVLNEP